MNSDGRENEITEKLGKEKCDQYILCEQRLVSVKEKSLW